MSTSGNGSGSLADEAQSAPPAEPVPGRAANGTRRFRPEWIPTLAVAAVLVLTLSAGRWQLDRAAYKVALQQRIEAAANAAPVSVQAGITGDASSMAWHPIEATGRFEADKVVFLDNRLRDGVPGYEVLTPLRLSGSDRVLLVNRGWIAAPRQRERLPRVETPAEAPRLPTRRRRRSVGRGRRGGSRR